MATSEGVSPLCLQMTPDEAMAFLQEVRFNLMYLQAQYNQEERMQQERQLLEQQWQQQLHDKVLTSPIVFQRQRVPHRFTIRLGQGSSIINHVRYPPFRVSTVGIHNFIFFTLIFDKRYIHVTCAIK